MLHSNLPGNFDFHYFENRGNFFNHQNHRIMFSQTISLHLSSLNDVSKLSINKTTENSSFNYYDGFSADYYYCILIKNDRNQTQIFM